MSYNLSLLDKEQKDRINTELAAAGVAFKERYNMPVIAEQVEKQQPEPLQSCFRQRLADYRKISVNLSRLAWEPKK